MDFCESLASVEEIIEDAQNGRMFILVDNEDRENEGDLVIPAQMATPEAVNFMAKYGRGLICLALTSDRIRALDLPPMARHNTSRHFTAFTVSIEAREGVTTGISAADRARTVATAIDATKGRDHIVTPGHIFPLEARDGGVLVRAGHTEGAVDLARLAGLNPAGVICEIMNDDGTMARLPDLVAFAQRHNLKIGTISSLISYRLDHDRMVKRTYQTVLNSVQGGKFDLFVYTDQITGIEHLALVKGDIARSGDPVLVRMHALNILDDVLGDGDTGRGGDLATAMGMIGEAGTGVVVLLREPKPGNISAFLKVRDGKTPEPRNELRDYGVGAQILLDLGVRRMTLLSNTERTIIGLEGYGLTVADRRSIPSPGRDTTA